MVFVVLAVIASAALLSTTFRGEGVGEAAGDQVVSISAGGFHTCALTAAGGVKCWGRNDSGQLGDGSTSASMVPVDVPELDAGIVAVSAGGAHTCALDAGGGVACWGRNDFGQLGDGTTTQRTSPVPVSGLSSGVTAISAGGLHTCALMEWGAVKCWGNNNQGQLGDGSTTGRTTPVDVVGLGGGVSGVAAGGSDNSGGHTCAWLVGGALKCWGRNDFGQLGDGTTERKLTPADVAGSGSGAAVGGGRYHSCALSTAGGVSCWGWNIGGQLGDGTTSTRTMPVGVVGLGAGVSQIGTGGMHTCALVADAAKCWGFNTSGELGDGTSGNSRTTPVYVLASPGGSPLDGVAAVTAGGSITTSGHSCALMVDGGVRCWGANGFGQLGDGSTTNRTTPVEVVGLAPKPTPTAEPTSTPAPTPTPTPTMPSSTAEERIEDLHDIVNGLDLPAGLRNSLNVKLDRALDKIEQGKICAAVSILNALLNQVEGLAHGPKLSAADAAKLIQEIEDLIDLLSVLGAC